MRPNRIRRLAKRIDFGDTPTESGWNMLRLWRFRRGRDVFDSERVPVCEATALWRETFDANVPRAAALQMLEDFQRVRSSERSAPKWEPGSRARGGDVPLGSTPRTALFLTTLVHRQDNSAALVLWSEQGASPLYPRRRHVHSVSAPQRKTIWIFGCASRRQQ
jgi:hypothetical protein